MATWFTILAFALAPAPAMFHPPERKRNGYTSYRQSLPLNQSGAILSIRTE